MAKSYKQKYNNEDGVWRTIGGRRVFIRTGQSLSDAMKESGKFKQGNRREVQQAKAEEKVKKLGKKNEELYKEYGAFADTGDKEKNKVVDKAHKKWLENAKEANELKDMYNDYSPLGWEKDTYNNPKPYSGPETPELAEAKHTGLQFKGLTEEGKRIASGNFKSQEEKEMWEKAGKETEELIKEQARSNNWREQIKKNNEAMNKKADEIYSQKGSPKYMYHPDQWEDDYYGTFRETERQNAKIKQEVPTEPYEYVGAYAGYRDKSYSLAGTKMEGKDVAEYGNKSWTGKEYTNDEFMEHLEDSNWHSERKMLLEAGLTNQELAYIKNKTTLSQWSVGEELTGSKNTQKLIDEAKSKFRSNGNDKYKATQHIGFGDYNKDGIPVYNNKIDNTGDFRNADLSKLSDDELREALNVQSQEWHKAMDEKLGDQRTRNGKMDKIFNTAKRQQYDEGMSKLNEEIDRRDLPRYNIYDDNGMIMASSPTKEMADKQLAEMYETDKKLQKEYGWNKLPKYSVKEESKKNSYDKMNYDDDYKKLYQQYLKEHKGSNVSLEDFKKWYK